MDLFDLTLASLRLGIFIETSLCEPYPCFVPPCIVLLALIHLKKVRKKLSKRQIRLCRYFEKS